MKVSWVSQYRVHGLKVDKPLEMTIRGKRNSAGTSFIVSVTFGDTPLPRPRIPHFMVVESQAKTFFEDGSSMEGQPGTWVTVVVSSDLTVPAELQKRFDEDRKATVDEVTTSLSEIVQAELFSRVERVAGICQAFFRDTVWERWCDQQRFYYSETAFTAHTPAGTVEVVKGATLSKEQLDALTPYLKSGLSQDSETGERLTLASNTLLLARSAPHGSNERFFGLFQSAEILSHLFSESDPDDPEVKQLQDLENLVATHRPDLKPILEKVKGRIMDPGLRERFRFLSEYLSPATAGSDQEDFRRINKLRGALVHGSIRRITKEGEFDPFKKAWDLGVRYLLASALERRHLE